jgi:5-methylthioadenosine/S-adenosylhomocysteine deaminase
VLGLDGLVGSIEAGKRADLVVYDLRRLEANPRHDLAANLLYSMSARCVRDVLVDGTVLVRDGKLTRADEAELAARHDALAAKLRGTT